MLPCKYDLRLVARLSLLQVRRAWQRQSSDEARDSRSASLHPEAAFTGSGLEWYPTR